MPYTASSDASGRQKRRAFPALVILASALALGSCGSDNEGTVAIVVDNAIADGFDFPVAPGEMTGWTEPPHPDERFDPSSYLVHREDGIHPSIDFFKEEGSSAGEELWAIADGVVVEIVYDREAYPDKHEGDQDLGWGNLILIQHDYVENGETKRVWAQYAHCGTVEVELNQIVTRNQRIGLVGKTDGTEGLELWDVEHLHFEIRTSNLSASAYPNDLGLDTDEKVSELYTHPIEFIREHRPTS
ncbi:MAG: M23 family metallopeptidase [Actinomycetia bacterium]|nr:M23 family metallopeptidase [Actinomycetes bacterium]MCP3909734.1 M23 family metallopeptidase [Actinomycetes bacterium]MCP4083977.1 M23 family metallopeptidase [Actinomycetes bacterium]